MPTDIKRSATPGLHCSSSIRCGTNSFPLRQARIVALLVERVDIGTDGLNVRLRVDGLGSLALEMLVGGIEAAA